MPEWKITEVPELRGYTVEWAEPGDFYLSRRNSIYHSADLKPPFTHVASVEAPAWKSLAANFRLAQRLLRFMVTNVVKLNNGDLFITFDKTVGVIRNGEYRTLNGLVRPCRVLRSGCAADREGNIYFGEYLANDARGPMRIYRYTPGTDELETVHIFPAGSIKHIHGIYADEFTGDLYCLTGDADKECGILRSPDGFRTMKYVGRGDESWRAVSLLFEKEALFYGTDAEFRKNQIYRVERGTLERTTLGEVSGTVFYSKSLSAHLFFATTAENAPSQTENVAALWHVSPEGECRQLVSYQKDSWHPTLFMFGTIHFPYRNALPAALHFSLVGVDGDNRTFNIQKHI